MPQEAKNVKALAEELTDKEFSALVAARCIFEARKMLTADPSPQYVQDTAMWVLSEGLPQDVSGKIVQTLRLG